VFRSRISSIILQTAKAPRTSISKRLNPHNNKGHLDALDDGNDDSGHSTRQEPSNLHQQSFL